MIEGLPRTEICADERVRRRYPAAYARAAACLREMAPDEANPVTAAEVEAASGFITREAVIAEILSAADWAREVSPGRFVLAEPQTASAVPGRGAKGFPAQEDPFVRQAKRALERETARNRVGVSAEYLRHFCGNPDLDALRALLDSAPWAVKQFGFYRYVPCEPENVPSGNGDAQIPLDPALVPREAERIADPVRAEEERTPKSAARFEQLSFQPPEKEREEVRVGTLLYARANRRQKITAIAVDFGRDIGVKKASVPTADLPVTEAFAGRQVVCRIAYGDGGCTLRVLGTDSEEGAAPLIPAEQVRNGERVKGLSDAR